MTAAILACTLAVLHAPFASATLDYSWSFPRDHWAHPAYRNEWWYLTGQLRVAGESAPRFGYQFTVFRVGLEPRRPPVRSAWATNQLWMGHAAITDLRSGEHRFAEVLCRDIPLLAGFGDPPDPLLAWAQAAPGTDGEWRLRWNGDAFDVEMRDREKGIAMQLSTHPEKPLVLHGENGFSAKNDDGSSASLYYSFTRLATRGFVTVDGERLEVEGRSWMDKEFGSGELGAGQVGWDWFSLQLDDGRDLMLYRLRDAKGATDHASGTVVDATGAARTLDGAEWTLRATRTWTSPASGIEYPAGWTISIPSRSLTLTVTPIVPGAENRSRLIEKLVYWEGPVRVTDPEGRLIGRGYVELTGYGKGGRLPR